MFYLDQFLRLDGCFDSIHIKPKIEPPNPAPDLEFPVIDIFTVVLGKSVEKNCPVSTLESNCGAAASALSLSFAGDALLDQSTAEVRIHKPGIGIRATIDDRNLAIYQLSRNRHSILLVLFPLHSLIFMGDYFEFDPVC